MATLPSQRTWTVGEFVTASMLNDDVRDAINFLLAPPTAILGQTAAQSVASSSNVALAWDNEVADTDGGHSNVTNNTRYTSQTPGYYDSLCTMAFAANATGRREGFHRANGDTAQEFGFWANSSTPSGSFEQGVITGGKVYLNTSQYLEVYVVQASGGALNTSTAHGGARWNIGFASA